jgi:hypothetical protein
MRRHRIVLAACCLVILLAQVVQADEWTTFRDVKKGFWFKYPSEWTVDQTTDSSVSVIYTAPDDSWTSNVQVNLMQAPPKESDPDVLALISNSIIDNLQKSIKDFKLIESSRFKMGKEKAQRIIFTGTQDKTGLGFMQIVAIRKSRVILITCTTTANKLADERPKFDKLIDSFELQPDSK